jgi:hypothetical protein
LGTGLRGFRESSLLECEKQECREEEAPGKPWLEEVEIGILMIHIFTQFPEKFPEKLLRSNAEVYLTVIFDC